MITDYSSVFFDYANLKRPMLFYMYDLSDYKVYSITCHFAYNFNDLPVPAAIHNDVPGPLLYTTHEVIDAVKNIDEINEQYSAKYEEFYNTFCNIDDGNASKRIVEKVWGSH